MCQMNFSFDYPKESHSFLLVVGLLMERESNLQVTDEINIFGTRSIVISPAWLDKGFNLQIEEVRECIKDNSVMSEYFRQLPSA